MFFGMVAGCYRSLDGCFLELSGRRWLLLLLLLVWGAQAAAGRLGS